MNDGTPCAYCGGIATEWDHVIPVALLRPSTSSNVTRYQDDDWIVPSCRECNGMLSDRMLHTVPLRAKWLMTAYKKRYAKLLRNAYWTEEELEELSGSFKQMVIESMRAQAELDMRLATLKRTSLQPMDYMQRRLTI